jgi:hypothetical protein
LSKVARFLAATTLALGSLFFASPAKANCVSVQQSETLTAVSDASTVAEVRTIETCGGDDVGYKIPLSVGVTFDGQTYDKVYATTNSVITFGRPDGTYWDYPQTASISLYSMDWLIIPSRNPDEHLIIQSSEGGFSVDISARPYWLYNTPEPTQIIITAAINYDGSVAISYMVAGPTYEGQTRTGVRLTSGDVVTLEEYGIVQVDEPVVLTAQPIPSPEPTPEPSPEIAPSPQPTQEPAPQPAPAPIPEPIPEIAPPVMPVEPPPAPRPIDPPVLAPVPPTPPTAPIPEPVAPEPLPEVIIPDPPVVGATPAQLAEEAKADDPIIPQELAAIPLLGDAAEAVLEAFNAIGNVGADLTPEVREQAEETIIASVIVSNIATTSVMASAASYRRIK